MASVNFGLHEVYQQIKSVAYGIWRKRWYMMATTWLICLVGWGAVSTMPYRYESSAQIFVNTETILPSIVRGFNINIDVSRRIEAVKNQLVTRPNLEKIIRRSEYLERLANNDAALNQLVADMQSDIRVAALQGSMYRIEYENGDGRLSDRQRAEVARNVVNNLLSIFLEGSSEGGDGSSENAVEFLDQQIQDYEERLSAAEQLHAQFKQENIDFLGGEGAFLSRRDEAKEELRDTRNKLGEFRVALDTLQEQIKNVPATIREAKSSRTRGAGSDDPLQDRINEQQKKLDNLRNLGYKDLHPDVRNVSRQLELLKAEQKEQQDAIAQELSDSAEAGKSSNFTTETPNRLYEQLMFNIIDTRTQIKTFEQREVEQQKLVAELEEKAKRVPEIQARESQLQRDFAQLRSFYNDLLDRKQDLDLQADVESADGAVSLRVVEQPNLPTRPSGPNRLLFMSGMLVFALMAGVGFALVLSVLRPVVLTVEQLRSQFDLNILGNVSRSLSEEETKQRSIELLMFAGATALLFIVFAGFVVFDMIGGTG